MKRNKQKGFTLIELLVVIAIIAILSTVVMAGLNSARLKGRDARRLSDIKQMQAAAELFFDSCGGYPNTFTTAEATGCPAGTTLATYMSVIPTPPTPQATPNGYAYTVGANRATYTLVFGLEGGSGTLTAGSHTATPSGIGTP